MAKYVQRNPHRLFGQTLSPTIGEVSQPCSDVTSAPSKPAEPVSWGELQVQPVSRHLAHGIHLDSAMVHDYTITRLKPVPSRTEESSNTRCPVATSKVVRQNKLTVIKQTAYYVIIIIITKGVCRRAQGGEIDTSSRLLVQTKRQKQTNKPK